MQQNVHHVKHIAGKSMGYIYQEDIPLAPSKDMFQQLLFDMWCAPKAVLIPDHKSGVFANKHCLQLSTINGV